VNLDATFIVENIQGSYRSSVPTKEECEYDGCEVTTNLEKHHINPQVNIRKDLSPFGKSLISSKRKTVTLCRKHHMELHKRRLFNPKPKKKKNE